MCQKMLDERQFNNVDSHKFCSVWSWSTFLFSSLSAKKLRINMVCQAMFLKLGLLNFGFSATRDNALLVANPLSA